MRISTHRAPTDKALPAGLFAGSAAMRRALDFASSKDLSLKIYVVSINVLYIHVSVVSFGVVFVAEGDLLPGQG